MNVKSLALTAFLALGATSVQANCYGTSNFYSCNDSNGNSYSVQKYGNSTYMQGYNSSTGSNWNQNSHTYGNTTQIYGNTNGRGWSETITPNAVYGTDSHGRSFYRNR